MTALTAAEYSKKLKNRELKATALISQCYEKIESTDSEINAFLSLQKEQALAQAEQIDSDLDQGKELPPLAGVPIAVKDNIHIKGQSTTCASKMLEGFKAPFNATVTEKLNANGLIPLGKCNLDEFAMGSSTEHSAYKVTKNPINTNYVPGGSSGGSAAAVAANMAPLSLGSDTGGSIRQPAAYCGIIGLKPSYGRVSRYGLVAFASSLDQIGPFARTVEDTALLLNAISGHDPKDSTSMQWPVPDFTANLGQDISGKKIGVPQEFLTDHEQSPAVQAMIQSLDALKQRGATWEPIDMSSLEDALSAYYILAPAEASSNLARFDGVRYGHRAQDTQTLKEMMAQSRGEGFGPEVQRRILLGTFVLSSGYYDAFYIKAQKVRSHIKNAFAKAFASVDLIATPTTLDAPFKIGEMTENPIAMYLTDLATIPVNLAGLPALSIPSGTNEDGLPFGLHLIGPSQDEAGILNIAHHHEEAQQMTQAYEAVIGIEVHAQLSTNSKLFSPSANAFGDSPNSNVNEICLGMPGALPVLNKTAVDLAIRAGIALNCEIQKHSEFARKNYFYPDLPKGYQISQFDKPICLGGHLDIQVEGEEKRIGITRIHMEEDAGKLLHQGAEGIAGATHSLVDLNRAGTPLIEIVSEPDIRTAAEARAYMELLAITLQYAGVCDGNLEQGSLRADANVSIRPKGQAEFGTRTETKNINSFRSLEKAINFEIQRQITVVESGEDVVQETRNFDDATGKTTSLRSKEDAHDYRYFPDPDLKPLILTDQQIKAAEQALPELPAAKAARYQSDFTLSSTETQVIISNTDLNHFFEHCIKSAAGKEKEIAKWLAGPILGLLKERQLPITEAKLSPESLLSLIALIEKGELSGKMAKELLPKLIDTGQSPASLLEQSGGAQISDSDELQSIVDQLLDENPDVVEKVKAGKTQSANFLMGQVMKATKGRAKPDLVLSLIIDTINAR